MRTLCFFNTYKHWGGAEKWHAAVARACRDHGDAVMVVTNRRSALFQQLTGEPNITLQPCAISNLSFLNPPKILALARLFKQHGVQTIVLNLSADMKSAGIAAKLAGVRQIIYRRGAAVPVKNSWLNRLLFRHVVTHVIANSQEIRRTMLQHNAALIPPERLTVLYNGLDLAAFDRQPVTLVPRNAGECVIGNAGRFVAQKGQHHLIELARRLKAQGERFRLLIAGSGELEGELIQAAADAGVADQIEFLGFVERMPQFFAEIDLFVLPSQHEGSSNTVLEAMAARKPVVAFNISSLPEMVVSGETGLLVEAGSVAALTQAVTTLIHDEPLRKTYGENGRKRVEERFSMQRMLRDFRALIEHE